MLIPGCTTKTTHNPEHTHEAEGLTPFTYTLYTDKTELFVEFKPLIVGLTTSFAAHFTLLGETFKPLEEGSVSVRLIVGSKSIKNTAAQPGSPGIYNLTLRPEAAGTGTLRFEMTSDTGTDEITIENIPVYADEKSAMENQPESTADSNDITYLKEQAWYVDFANTEVKKQAFSSVIKTSGQILSAPGDEIMITAKANGIVLFSGNTTIIGSEVNKGTALFTISDGDLAEGNIKAAYKEARANYEKAKADYNRASVLVKDKIVSEKEFRATALNFENAKTAYNTVAKNYSGKGVTMTSPMQGFVKNILVTEGQFVAAGSPLAVVSGNKRLMLQAQMSQKYFNILAAVTSANFQTVASQTVYDTEALNGKMISYGKSIVVNAPFIPITFEIDNTGSIIPGSTAEVYLKTAPIPDAIVVPVSALIEEQSNFFVYVQTGGETFQKRPVKLGANDGIHVQVTSGIAEGERVVTKGAYHIKLTTASGAIPEHGHEH